MDSVLAIDPGTHKCGIAVVTSAEVVLQRSIIASDELEAIVSDWVKQFAVTRIVVGDRTHSKPVCKRLETMGLIVEKVDEDRSSLEGRRRYLRDHSRGLWRLIPIGLRVPDQPYDDYVAVILAERYFQSKNVSDPWK